MKFALIPVKDLDGAKTRLGKTLDAPARRDLVVAMYRDVLTAANACSSLDGVFVVSESEEVLAIAEAAGAQGIVPDDPSTGSGSTTGAPTPGGPSTDSGSAIGGSGAGNPSTGSGPETKGSGAGLNADLTLAARRLAQRGATRLLVLFADLPCANAEAIERVLSVQAGVAIVPARDGGTNALSLTPGAIEFRYGPDSAAKHLAEAEHAGLSVARLDEPSLALDIDTVDDLATLRTADGVGSHTRTALAAIVTPGTGRTHA
jgi:2-phospho-L-lactate guanylyltransferase